VDCPNPHVVIGLGKVLFTIDKIQNINYTLGMTTPQIPSLPWQAMSPALAGYDSSRAFGQDKYKEYMEKREEYRGRVVEMCGRTTYERRGFDGDGDNIHRIFVTAMSVDGKSVETFITDAAIVGIGGRDRHCFQPNMKIENRATVWAIDATPDVMVKYKKYLVTVEIPNKAAQEATLTKNELIQVLDTNESVLNNTPKRGWVYEVAAGKKFPRGLRGVFFWSGQNKWGVSYGLSTSDRKLPNGRNADVIFVQPKNLKLVATDEKTTAAQAVIQASRDAADTVYSKKYANVIQEEYTALAEKWGCSVHKLYRRAAEVANQELESMGVVPPSEGSSSAYAYARLKELLNVIGEATPTTSA
jgi:hypothetical protein